MNSWEKIKEGTNEIANDAIGKGKEYLTKGVQATREGTYKVVGTLEQGLHNVGEAIERDAREEEGFLYFVAEMAEEGYDKARTSVNDLSGQVNEWFRARGGVKGVADQAAHEVGKRTDKLYARFHDEFFTAGEFDREKAKAKLKDGAGVVRTYGLFAAQEIGAAVKEGAQALKQDYRAFVPTREEREKDYEGIGDAVPGLVLRPRLDACLEFLDEVQANYHHNAKHKAEVLDEITAFAITNGKELKSFYLRELTLTEESKTVNKEKLERLEKYHILR